MLIRERLLHREATSAAVAVTLAELIEIVRDLTRRVAMLEVEDAGRQATRADVEADEDG